MTPEQSAAIARIRICIEPKNNWHVTADEARLLLSALEEAQAVRADWQPIETAPKNRKVLAAYRNELGNWRIVTACYHTELPWSDDHDPRETDGEFAPEGWYEESDSSETIYRTSSLPTQWQPLPAPPALTPTGAQE